MCYGFDIVYDYYIIPRTSAFHSRTVQLKKYWEVLCSKYLQKYWERFCRTLVTGILQKYWKVFCKIAKRSSTYWHMMSNFLVKTQGLHLFPITQNKYNNKFFILIKTWRWYRREGAIMYKYVTIFSNLASPPIWWRHFWVKPLGGGST